ncbi:autotransporter outer membrane beta-barrel domain-containing protein [Polynucleobacter sp. Ross1-W9]|uniref:beta strand repeat-containing protein n=1 Tax=Polynucleobacter parvulilacunae TaxID=1855631 RepID=UPI001C0C92BF|nr:autotransporter outer membrane beta-barrel domain-containing protein [Polynucleobacter parvulilacunae]MBU3556212.1 autotransporter outer membrane beta-barrel domain-containing protein [Polynucleobacter parvulilacunae]
MGQTNINCSINANGQYSATSSGAVCVHTPPVTPPTWTNLGTGLNSYWMSTNGKSEVQLINNSAFNDIGGPIAVYGMLINGNNATVTNNSQILVSSVGIQLNTAAATGATITNGVDGKIQADYGVYLGSSNLSISLLNNFGSIVATKLGGTAIYNQGAIGEIYNGESGLITATSTSGGTAIGNGGAISLLNNYGQINSVSSSAISNNRGTIGTINNYGSGSIAGISQTSSGSIGVINNLGDISGSGQGGDAIRILFGGEIGTINNSGRIYTNGTGILGSGINNGVNGSGPTSATIGEINNLAGGLIAGTIGINNSSLASIGTINNSGSISSTTGGTALKNAGQIDTITNNGSIYSTGGGTAIANNAGGSITTITNNGSMYSTGGGFGINNTSGTITTLANLQGVGNPNGPLTYTGNLPTTYTTLVNGTQYGQLAVSNGVGSVSTYNIEFLGPIQDKSLTNVVSGTVLPSALNIIDNNKNSISATTGISGSLMGQYAGINYHFVQNADGTYDLLLSGATVPDTDASITLSAQQVQSILTSQSSALINSLSYDCNTFGENGICLSTGGRYQTVDATTGMNSTSALIIAAVKAAKQVRIGAYADQNLSNNTNNGSVKLDNGTPMVGIFAAWSENDNGTGAEVKVSAGLGQKSATITRPVVNSAEPGQGSTNIYTQSVQLVGKYGFAVTDNLIISPYAGIRYLSQKVNGYSEGANANVTLPLSYSAINANATTALAGVGITTKATPELTLMASAGLETNLSSNYGTWTVTGAYGGATDTVQVNPNQVNTRATASIGAYYAIEKNQTIGITGIYRQEPFQNINTTNVMMTYTIGL